MPEYQAICSKCESTYKVTAGNRHIAIELMQKAHQQDREKNPTRCYCLDDDGIYDAIEISPPPTLHNFLLK